MMLHRLTDDATIDQDRSLISAYSVDAAAGEVFDWHRHPRDQLVFARHGLMRVRVPDALWLVPDGHALCVPAGMPHAVEMLDRVAMRTLYAAPSLFVPPAGGCRVVLVGRLLEALILEATTTDLRGARAAAIATLLVDEVARAPEAGLRLPEPRDPRLVRLCQALRARPSDDATLLQWAARIGSSERTLARLFAKEFGMGFREWRTRLRLEQALTQLRAGSKREGAARSVGYRSRSAFRRALLRRFGG